MTSEPLGLSGEIATRPRVLTIVPAPARILSLAAGHVGPKLGAGEAMLVDDEVLELVANLRATLDTLHGWGIAAPQVGVSKRVILARLQGATSSPTVLINPRLLSTSPSSAQMLEACFSVPGRSAKVRRALRVEVSAFGEDGRPSRSPWRAWRRACSSTRSTTSTGSSSPRGNREREARHAAVRGGGAASPVQETPGRGRRGRVGEAKNFLSPTSVRRAIFIPPIAELLPKRCGAGSMDPAPFSRLSSALARSHPYKLASGALLRGALVALWWGRRLFQSSAPRNLMTQLKLLLQTRLPAISGKPLTAHKFPEDVTPSRGVPLIVEGTVGAELGEPYAILFRNPTAKKLEVRVSIDGLDILTGQPADLSIAGQKWLVPAHGELVLEAWPESASGGARFVFAPEGMAVADHRPTGSPKGIIAAAVFEEGAMPLPSIMRGMGPQGSPESTQNYSFGGAATKGVGTGMGERVAQTLHEVRGLREPRLLGIWQIKVVLWSDLQARLAAVTSAPQAHVDLSPFGFPGEKAFVGPGLENIPRLVSALAPSRLG